MDNKEIKELVLTKYTEAEKFKTPHDVRWLRNTEYTFGNQWLSWNNKNTTWETSLAPSWKKDVRVVANRIFTTLRSVLVKLLARKIELSVFPKIQEPEIYEVSRIAQKIVEYVLTKHRDIQYNFGFNLLCYGKSFIKCSFDPSIGKQVVFENIAGVETPITIKLGDIVLSLVMPYELYIDPLATSIYDARYCFLVRVRDKEYVRERYDVNIDNIKNTSITPSILQSIDNIMGKKTQNIKDAVVVKEYWQKASKNYPKGLYVLLINDEIIKSIENPYLDINGEPYLPFVEANFFVNNNQLYGTSLVDQLIPLQNEYNSLRTEIVLQEKSMTKPKWLIPAQCGISQNALTSEIGEKVIYDARGGVPQPVQGIPPSSELWNHIAYIKNEFDDIAGIHDVSRGKVPSGIRGHQAIAYLQEQDDSLLSITYSNIIDAYINLAYMIISQAYQFYQEDRVLTIIGKNGINEAVKFLKGSLHNIDKVSIGILEGSKLPTSFVGRQQYIISLYQSGIIRDPNKVLKLLEFTPDDEVYQDNRLDEINAKTENDLMANGIYAEVQDFDNHQVHIDIHNNFRKALKFKELPNEIKEMFLMHTQTHQKMVDLQMQQMLAMQQQGKQI